MNVAASETFISTMVDRIVRLPAFAGRSFRKRGGAMIEECNAESRSLVPGRKLYDEQSGANPDRADGLKAALVLEGIDFPFRHGCLAASSPGHLVCAAHPDLAN